MTELWGKDKLGTVFKTQNSKILWAQSENFWIFSDQKCSLAWSFYIVNLKNNSNNLVKESWNIKFYKSLLYFIIPNHDSYDQIKKYMVQSKSKRQRLKSTSIINYPCSCLLICKQKIVCIIQHLKNNFCIINQRLCNFL